MENNSFLKSAEEVTMKKLLDFASKMIRTEEIIASLSKSLVLAKKPDHVLREYLLQKAELARLGRAIDEAIRCHEILCHDCGEPHKLKNVALMGIMPRVILRCPQSIMSVYEQLSEVEAKSLENILRFVQGETKDIFDSKVP